MRSAWRSDSPCTVCAMLFGDFVRLSYLGSCAVMAASVERPVVADTINLPQSVRTLLDTHTHIHIHRTLPPCDPCELRSWSRSCRTVVGQLSNSCSGSRDSAQTRPTPPTLGELGKTMPSICNSHHVADVRQDVADVGQTWAKVGQYLARFRQFGLTFANYWPMFGSTDQNLAEFGQQRPDLANLALILGPEQLLSNCWAAVWQLWSNLGAQRVNRA